MNMAIKDFLTKKSFELMQDPRVMKVMQDERMMKAMMGAIRLRGRLQDEIDGSIDKVAESLNLATKKELREMKRSLRRMEVELERAQRSS